MLVHFSAGTCVGMAALLVYNFKENIVPPIGKSIWIGLVYVLIIGLLWEVYELYFEITSLADGIDYYLDTISDVIMDLSGGLLGSLYAHYVLAKQTKHE